MRENAHQRDGGHLSKWVLEIITGLGLVLGDLGHSSWGLFSGWVTSGSGGNSVI